MLLCPSSKYDCIVAVPSVSGTGTPASLIGDSSSSRSRTELAIESRKFGPDPNRRTERDRIPLGCSLTQASEIEGRLGTGGASRRLEATLTLLTMLSRFVARLMRRERRLDMR